MPAEELAVDVWPCALQLGQIVRVCLSHCSHDQSVKRKVLHHNLIGHLVVRTLNHAVEYQVGYSAHAEHCNTVDMYVQDLALEVLLGYWLPWSSLTPL